jgi:hypothetical protein
MEHVVSPFNAPDRNWTRTRREAQVEARHFLSGFMSVNSPASAPRDQPASGGIQRKAANPLPLTSLAGTAY